MGINECFVLTTLIGNSGKCDHSKFTLGTRNKASKKTVGRKMFKLTGAHPYLSGFSSKVKKGNIPTKKINGKKYIELCKRKNSNKQEL